MANTVYQDQKKYKSRVRLVLQRNSGWRDTRCKHYPGSRYLRRTHPQQNMRIRRRYSRPMKWTPRGKSFWQYRWHSHPQPHHPLHDTFLPGRLRIYYHHYTIDQRSIQYGYWQYKYLRDQQHLHWRLKIPRQLSVKVIYPGS